MEYTIHRRYSQTPVMMLVTQNSWGTSFKSPNPNPSLRHFGRHVEVPITIIPWSDQRVKWALASGALTTTVWHCFVPDVYHVNERGAHACMASTHPLASDFATRHPCFASVQLIPGEAPMRDALFLPWVEGGRCRGVRAAG